MPILVLVAVYLLFRNLIATVHSLPNVGSKGEGEGQFNEPEHLAVDSKGYVYVSDRANDNIQSFAPSSNC